MVDKPGSWGYGWFNHSATWPISLETLSLRAFFVPSLGIIWLSLVNFLLEVGDEPRKFF
jgi:hypothetical protein